MQSGSWEILLPVRSGAVPVLHYSQRLYNMPLGVFGIALATAIFPYFTAAANRKDHAGLIKTLVKGLRLVAFIGIAATMGLIIIRQSLVEFILGGGISGLFGLGPGEFGPEDVARVSTTLAFYCLGIWAYCGVHVVVRGFYALQDTLTPVKVGVWLVALNIPLNLILIWPLGTGGLALSTAICAALNLVILTRLLNRRIEKLPVGGEQADEVQTHQPLREVAAALPKIILATALMGAAVYGALVLTEKWVGSGVGQSGVRLGAAVLAGVAVYYLAAKLLGCRELDELLGKK
jgi:putative peptidoglycan lipid II flippase